MAKLVVRAILSIDKTLMSWFQVLMDTEKHNRPRGPLWDSLMMMNVSR